MPLERQGVPQHSSGRSVGCCSVMPACRQSCSNDSRTPGPALLGPNMVPTHAVKYTASATGAGPTDAPVETATWAATTGGAGRATDEARGTAGDAGGTAGDAGGTAAVPAERC